MATILVTGGLGAVGSPLVDELEFRGHDVWVADLPWNERERYDRIDVSEYRQLERIFDEREFDYVYHLDAEFGRKNGRISTRRCGIRMPLGPKTSFVSSRNTTSGWYSPPPARCTGTTTDSWRSRSQQRSRSVSSTTTPSRMGQRDADSKFGR